MGQWPTLLDGPLLRLKMTILPKLLYLLQALPIFIPADYFKQVRSAFIKFLWAGKKPRLHQKILTPQAIRRPLPELATYYHKTHLGRLLDWYRRKDTKLWPQLEQAQCETPLHRAPWCYTALPLDLKRQPLIGNPIKICAQLITTFSLLTRDSPLRPILGNPQFEPGIRDKRFCDLDEAGLHQASHFSASGRWKTITELSDPMGQFRLDFMRALQLCHFHSLPPPAPPTSPSQLWKSSVQRQGYYCTHCHRRTTC